MTSKLQSMREDIFRPIEASPSSAWPHAEDARASGADFAKCNRQLRKRASALQPVRAQASPDAENRSGMA
ncbi:hypothetical protein G6F63_016850 [Rhizopus arrhizus]|nr:hypothetical protein G6F63_016850 [Rhizopus arrhizus]